MKREETHQIIKAISSYNPFTKFIINLDDELILCTEIGKITRTQALLARRYTDEIKEFLQTPPLPGECRNGHAVRWQCTMYGVWVCMCYFEKKEEIKVVRGKSELVGYWNKKTYI